MNQEPLIYLSWHMKMLEKDSDNVKRKKKSATNKNHIHV